MGAFARQVPLASLSLVAPIGRGVGQLSPSPTPSTSASPHRGDLARCSSTQVALEPFRRGAGSGGVFRCGSAPPSQRTRLDSHPRVLGGLPRESSQLGSNGISPSGAVRDLAVVDPPPFLFPASRQVRTPSELGRDAATCVAKTGAAITVGKPFRTNFAAPVFRLAASVSP